MKKSITLKHIGYRCEGIAVLNLWGGGQGEINMDSWDVKKGDRDSIVQGVNDGQFGCQSIKSATVAVYDLYENNLTIFDNEIIFNSSELTSAKTGI